MVKHVTRVALVALLMGAFLSACGSDKKSSNADATTTTAAAAKTPELNIGAKEYAFTAPASVESGFVKVSLDNTGKLGHQAQLLRLNDGVTLQQLGAAAAGDPTGEKVLQLVSIKGGVNAIAPGAKQSAVSKLDPGQYLAVCFLPTPDGKSTHIAQGMQAPFTVTAAASAGAEPKYDYTVEAKDFQFTLPAIKSGEHTIEFKNNGPSPHEMTMYKVAAGKTAADVQKFLSAPPGTAPAGPPPFAEVGGAAAILPTAGTFPTLTFDPGTYVVTCFVPDPKTGKPHIALGMFSSFDVK
jgi:plastocyanin